MSINPFHNNEKLELSDRKDALIELAIKFQKEKRLIELEEDLFVGESESFGKNRETQRSTDHVVIDLQENTTYSHSKVNNNGTSYDIYAFLSGKEFGYMVLDGKNIEYVITADGNDFQDFSGGKISRIPESEALGGKNSLEGFAKAITYINQMEKKLELSKLKENAG